MVRNFALALLATLLASSVGNTACAQQAVQLIDQELSGSLREPVRNFLVRLGVSDVEAALRATKMAEPSPGGPSFRILRFEHTADCYKDRCPTVIAEVANGSIVPQAILFAENRVIAGDVIEPFWGSPSVSYMFPSGETMLILRRISQGWIVGSAVNTLPTLDRRKMIVPQAHLSPPPPELRTFEDFQQTLRKSNQWGSTAREAEVCPHRSE